MVNSPNRITKIALNPLYIREIDISVVIYVVKRQVKTILTI